MKKLFPALLLFIYSCSSDAQVSVLKPTEFAAAVQAGQAQVLDARTADEYKSGHLNNALQANWLNKAEFEDRTQIIS